MSTAIVTGAGSGIGEAIAVRLAREGYAVAVNDVSATACERVTRAIEAAGGTARAYTADVADVDSVTVMAANVQRDLGSPKLVVNNAGFGQQAAFLDISPEAFDRMFAVHVRGTFLVTRAFLPAMLSAGEGVIINIASQLGQIGGTELVHYSGAKGAIIAMTKSLAREVSAKGVRVNAVAPGPINTPLGAARSADCTTPKAAGLPLGRFGEPAEIAGVVAFLASSDAALFVGQTLGPNSGDVML